MKLHTEKEHLIHNQHFAFRLRNLYLNDYLKFCQLADYIPTAIHINRKDNFDITYANHKLINRGQELENLVEKGTTYLKEISCPLLMQNAINKANIFKLIDDRQATCTYTQHLKVNNKMTYFYTNKLHLNDNLYFNASNFLDEIAGINNLVSSIFSSLRNNQTCWLQFQSLTKQEKNIIKLIAQGNSNQMIADLNFISLHTVKSHRKNIYRKLNINSVTELVKFSFAMDLL
ncbi:response regulator transcription factor [Winogradskyella psychrotolerans]|uniref:response regulator transcription factor n=1 Tax=Winogradskyella psychrotolerans TaxID=1344585 RepID=UPI001C0788C6|nr:helix-turn-helix transcriptional regulator [Winogradskyella psychrotolerans]MBU2927258.1 helix-turn-helix transcriptional regulator [Winogradskyella psychrotolerans]